MNPSIILYCNMKFFRLNNSSVVNEVGFFPQVFDAVLNFNIYDKNSAYHLNFAEANDQTLWPIAKLSTKAKKTDLVSVSFMSLSNKLLISKKMFSIIANSSHSSIQLVKSKLITRGKEEDYWIINPLESKISCLDIHNSSFAYLQSIGSNTKTQLKCNNLEEVDNAFVKNKDDAKSGNLANHKPLIIDTVSIKEDCDDDFFALSPVCFGGIGFFVSEKLKNEIQEAGCTGIVFTEPNERYP